MDRKILDLLDELCGVKEDHEEGQDNNAAQANNEEVPLATFEFYINSNNDLCCQTNSMTALLDIADLEQIFPKRLRAIIGNKIMLTLLEKDCIKAQEAQNGTDTGSL